MAFTPINTQEELDAIITARVERERTAVAKQYADYEDLKKQNETLKQQLADSKTSAADADKRIAELTTQIKGFETDALKLKVAQEIGVPLSLRDRLQGNTEDEIREDAQKFIGYIGESQSKQTKRAPEPNPEPGAVAASTDAGLMSMVRNLNFGG